jgi:hypothetical protein
MRAVKTKLFIYVILLWAVISIACGSLTPTPLLPWLNPTSTRRPTYTPKNYIASTATEQRQAMARATDTQAPANTPSPAPTINATKTALMSTVIAYLLNTVTPQPSATLWSNLESCDAIKIKYDAATSLQWDKYVDSVRGKNIHFSGDVINVHSDNEVYVVSGDPCDYYLEGIPYNTAIRISPDKQVEGYGTIEDIYYDWFYPDVYINVILDTLIIR